MASERLSRVLLISSPAVRAKETTEVMLRSSGIACEVFFDAEVYDADLRRLRAVIGRTDNHHDTVILVGHNPGVEALIRFLTGEIRAMSTCSLAKIKLNVKSWTDISGGEGYTEWLKTPELA